MFLNLTATTSGQPEDDDDGFGDFLGGPTLTTPPSLAAAPAVIQAAPTGNAASNSAQPSPAAGPSPEPSVGEPQPNPSDTQVVEKKG